MAIIKKYRYGLFEPSCGKDEINSMISVDIPRLDQQAARRRDQLNRLPPGCRELKLNPVVSGGGADSATLDTGEIGMLVAVEIGDCERCARSNRGKTRIMNIRSGRRSAAAKEAHEEDQNKRPET